MLVLKRKDGEWLDIRHRSGDLLRIRIYGIKGQHPGRVNLAFDDPEHHFDIQRPERPLRLVASPPPAPESGGEDGGPEAAA
ncbi:MAG: hypothetical protein KatS3mg108_0494 [Isosphaeraceae bacterium]|jgi:sRNA-binding carbon storage regulator CsrA|nr:MAG: hypothetical protein KatS3mg108_0494 [Isosphaeraceae bacterium]